MKKIYILFIPLICLLACDKTFLEAKPNISLLIPTTLNDFQSLLDNSEVMNRTPGLQGLSADDFYVSYSNWNAYNSNLQRNAYVWAPDLFGGVSASDWNVPYKQIFYANVVLEGLSNVVVTSSNSVKYNELRGAALFYRAYAYYQLMQIFAKPYVGLTAAKDLGVLLRLKSDVNLKIGRASVAEVYDLMLKDLTESVEILPQLASVKTRPSKVAAFALLSNIYLTMQDYEKAFFAAKKVIEVSEILLDYNSLNPAIARPLPSILPENKNPEVLFISTLNGFSYTGSQATITYIDTNLLKSYEADDLRKKIFFLNSEGKTAYFRGSYTSINSAFSGLSLNDTYLIIAETNARLGRVSEALLWLNKLLEKRWLAGKFMSKTASNAEEALKLILLERRKELVGRGTRWFDLRRLNLESDKQVVLTRNLNGVEYRLLPNDNKYVFPIPDNEMENNVIDQNIR